MTERRKLLWDNERGAWWITGGHGYTLDIDRAQRFDTDAAERLAANSRLEPGKELVVCAEPTGQMPGPMPMPGGLDPMFAREIIDAIDAQVLAGRIVPELAIVRGALETVIIDARLHTAPAPRAQPRIEPVSVPPVTDETLPPPAGRLDVVAWRLLNQACTLLGWAFDETPYLVGSARLRGPYNDVDVRIIVEDERYQAMFPGIASTTGELHPRWSVLCTALSLWLRQVTGLPVDLQIQSMTHANEYEGPRQPLGIFPVAAQ